MSSSNVNHRVCGITHVLFILFTYRVRTFPRIHPRRTGKLARCKCQTNPTTKALSTQVYRKCKRKTKVLRRNSEAAIRLKRNAESSRKGVAIRKIRLEIATPTLHRIVTGRWSKQRIAKDSLSASTPAIRFAAPRECEAGLDRVGVQLPCWPRFRRWRNWKRNFLTGFAAPCTG